MKNFKNYNLFNVLIFNLFFCFYVFSQEPNNAEQYAKDVNERIEKSSKKELKFLSKSLLDYYLKTNEDLNLEIDINAELNNKINNQQSLIKDFVNKVNNKDSLIDELQYREAKLTNANKSMTDEIKFLEDRIEIAYEDILIQDTLYNELTILYNKLVIERDSLIQDAVLNIYSKKNNNKDDFLNKMLLKKVKIDNQNFMLVPHGIITESLMEYVDNYDKEYIDQFIPLSNLLIGVISKPIAFELSRSFTSPYEFIKTAFWDPIKKMNYSTFLSRYNNYFPKFNFTQGRLLNIKTLGGESDYLSIISDYPERKNYNDKGFFFELVDENQNKFIIPTIVIGTELYIYLDTQVFENLSYSFHTDLKGSIGQRINSYGQRYQSNDAYELLNYHKEYNNISIIKISENHVIGKLGLYFFTKNSFVRKSRNVIPKGFLFKLEEIN